MYYDMAYIFICNYVCTMWCAYVYVCISVDATLCYAPMYVCCIYMYVCIYINMYVGMHIYMYAMPVYVTMHTCACI